jgi:nitroreductase
VLLAENRRANRQYWAFIVVRDPDWRRQLGAIYRKASDSAQAV